MTILLPLFALAAWAAAGKKAERRDKKVHGRRPPTTREAIASYAREVTASRRKAARKLVRYFSLGGREKLRIAQFQRRIGHIVANGLVDRSTRLRCLELLGPDAVNWGDEHREHRLPAESPPAILPAKKPDPLADLLNLPAAKAAPLGEASSSILRPTPSPTRSTPKPAPSSQRSTTRPAERPERSPAEKAAGELDVYLSVEEGRDRAVVAKYQRKMDGLDPDGLPGQVTWARARTLLGRSPAWRPPLSVTGPAPSPSDPKAAANELADYLTVYSGNRRDRIAAYQSVLGLGADGLIGPKTRARVLELTGRKV